MAREPVVGKDRVRALHSVIGVLEDLDRDSLAAEEGDGGVELAEGGVAATVDDALALPTLPSDVIQVT